MQGVGLKTTAQEMEEALASLEHKDEVSMFTKYKVMEVASY